MAEDDDDGIPADDLLLRDAEPVAHETDHGGVLPHPVFPTTRTDRLNRLVARFPMPVACWRIQHAYFAFDSSVILPTLSRELPSLQAYCRDDRLATIFGHADPVGDDEFNKRLSGRRARALFGLLTRNVAIWLDLFGTNDVDHWGLSSTQIMLAFLVPPDGEAPYYGGAIDGATGPMTLKAIRGFQNDQGLQPDGVAGPITRSALYLAYMDAICISPKLQFKMLPSDFLGEAERNETGDGKGAYQGCSEFNPVRLLGTTAQKQLNKEQRDNKNAVNRRIMVFFFRKEDFGPVDGPQIAQKWPCPAWSEDTSKCRTQFWSNGEQRRSPAEEQRDYSSDRQTMACSWYDRLARLSPCESTSEPVDVSIFLLDHFHQRMGANPSSPDPIAQIFGAPYRLVVGSGQARVGYADKDGLLFASGVVASGVCTLQWGKQEGVEGNSPPEDEDLAQNYYLYSKKIYLNTAAGKGRTTRQLHNLGYSGSASERHEAFAVDYGSTDDADVDAVHQTGRPGSNAAG